MDYKKVTDLRDCGFALLLGMGTQTALMLYMCWRIYKDCQP